MKFDKQINHEESTYKWILSISFEDMRALKEKFEEEKDEEGLDQIERLIKWEAASPHFISLSLLALTRLVIEIEKEITSPDNAISKIIGSTKSLVHEAATAFKNKLLTDVNQDSTE